MHISPEKLCKKCRAKVRKGDAEYMKKYRQQKKVENKPN